MPKIPAPPPMPDLTSLAENEAITVWRQYQHDAERYAFRYRWLPTVVDAETYTKVIDLNESLLRELYPWIALFGPAGDTYITYLRQLGDVLDAVSRGDSQAVVILHDFITTYNRLYQDGRWSRLFKHAKRLQRETHLSPEIELVDEEPVASVYNHPVWPRVISNPAVWQNGRKSDLMDNFAAMVLMHDLMLQDPGWADWVAKHESFLTRAGWA